MSMSKTDKLTVWLDLECTGSNPPINQSIIEVGVILTDGDLNELRATSIVVNPIQAHYAAMADKVRAMHTKNGLLADIDSGCGVELWEAQRELLDWLPDQKGHIPIGGSGVAHYDRRFLDHWMPKFSRRLSYWHYDVGTVRRLIRRRCKRVDLLPEWNPLDKNHRALDDARLHLNEWRYYERMINSIPKDWRF